MGEAAEHGWQALIAGFPWFEGGGRFPLPAYSEFMPPPRLGMSPYGDLDESLFSATDPFGWRVQEVDELHQLRPGLQSVANQVMGHLLRFMADISSVYVAGPSQRNLKGNPYWSDELASHAPQLAGRRHVLLMPLAIAKTQNDRGRRHWTLFGGSEQGPERAFWKSFYSAPGREIPRPQSRRIISNLLSGAFDVTTRDADELYRAGFRILASGAAHPFPDWVMDPLPSWTRRYLVSDDARFERTRFLLTFRPFASLPAAVREGYLNGRIELLPSPFSLLLSGMPIYHHASRQHPLALQYPVLRLVARHESWGLRVPQLGWLRHKGPAETEADAFGEVTLNEYARTHRWERLPRDEDAAARGLHISSVATTLFSTKLADLDLYHKPMARNCQIWTRDGDLILDGPRATRADLRRAADRLLQGGLFLYRFQFPAMRVGRHEVYWHRPLCACSLPGRNETQLLDLDLNGYLTAYDTERPDYVRRPVELYPRVLRRQTHLDLLQQIDRSRDRYRYQTSLNVLNIFDMAERWPGRRRLPRSFAEEMLRVAQDKQRFGDWLSIIPERCTAPVVAQRLVDALDRRVQPTYRRLPRAITYRSTATRAYEQAYWQYLVTLSHGKFVNKANSDVIRDPSTLQHVTHDKRDLLALGDFLIAEHKAAIAAAGMEGVAFVGEHSFKWDTDFEYEQFGGWASNQDGSECERNIVVVIPGKDRSQAVVMGDHYDTAYMEDVYEVARGGTGARISAQGADDNASATATLLLAASQLLKLAKEGKLERDVWLVHLTGEEFPSDCLGARALCQALVERTLKVRVDERWVDLSNTRLAGVLVMDMIAHNRSTGRNIFQISPGRSAASLTLAYEAHLANLIWNDGAARWNRRGERVGCAAGVRSPDASTPPAVALHPILEGEIRTNNNPLSSLFNTDVQIFSDIGAPCVLVMENYDINRSGYHDTKDTLANIDLDYGAAVSAICIETIARVACGSGVSSRAS
jgi:Peptidase family M28